MRDAERKDVVPSQCFFDECIHVGKGCLVGEVRKTMWSDDCIKFSLCFSQDLRIERHGKEHAL